MKYLMHSKIFVVIVAFFIDRAIGDPEFRFHPIRFIGKLIYHLEKILNRGSLKILKGCVLLFLTAGIVYTVFSFFESFANGYLFFIIETIFLYFGFSSKELVKRGMKIDQLLNEDKLEDARFELSMIVGRDTKDLSKDQIRMAVVETVSENFSDGFIAPLFYYLLGGLKLIYLYKAVNTLDSMVGYKNERYKEFGLFSAKFDDILNFIPARLSVIIFFIATFDVNVLKYAIKYGKNHTSPNAGYPEAAIAGALRCRLGGPNYYNGALVDKPWIGEINREIESADLLELFKIVNWASYLFIFIVTIILFCFKW